MFLLTEAQSRLGALAGVLACADAAQGTASVAVSLGLQESGLPHGPLSRGDDRGSTPASLVFGTEPYARVALAEPAWQRAIAQDSVPGEVRTWFVALSHTYRTMLSVPFDVSSGRYGSLWLFYVSPPEQLNICLASVDSISGLASLAIENTQLRLKAEQAAILQERSRLARDLHDSVTQSLYSLTLMMEAVRRLAKSGDLLQVQRALDRLELTGHQALREMRLLVYQLRPSVLRRMGLVRALSQRLETVEKRAGVDATLVVEGVPQLSPLLDEQLYYVAQEALNNSLKHAAASRVDVRITGDTDTLCLEIIDDGRGFDPAWDEAECGFGMASMRERVEKLGGQLVIRSERNCGTKVKVLLQHLGAVPEGSEI